MDRSRGSDDGARGGMPPLPPQFDPRGRARGRRVRDKHAAPSPVLAGATTRPGAHAIGPVRAGLRVVAAAVSVFLVVYIGYLWSSVHNIDNKVSRITVGQITPPTTSNGSTTTDADGKDQNLLIVGNDDRTNMTAAEAKKLHTGRGEGSLSTDTMMIVHIPADGSKATLVSLPRDSYVSIPGYGMNKLNAAYSRAYNASNGSHDAKIAAGMTLLIQTITNLTGMHIDHFVQVGLIGFYRISNAIGGVKVNLCNAVDDSYSGLKLSAGEHTIKGVQALEFVRQRHGLNGSDLDRVQRQRYFLTAAFRQVASAGTITNPSRLGKLVDAVDSSLYVDSTLKILDLARQMSNLSANNIVGKTIPIVRDDPNTSAGDALIVDPSAVKAFFRALIGTDSSAYTSAKTVDPSTVTVSVLNAGSINGAATAATKTLDGAGFTASVGTDQPDTQDTTTIEYPKGQESQAKTLAAYVPGATVEQNSNVSTVTLMLGSDKLTAKASPATASSSASTSGSATSSTSKAPTAIDAKCIN